MFFLFSSASFGWNLGGLIWDEWGANNADGSRPSPVYGASMQVQLGIELECVRNMPGQIPICESGSIGKKYNMGVFVTWNGCRIMSIGIKAILR